jgi:HK97 family phage prohead protease
MKAPGRLPFVSVDQFRSMREQARGATDVALRQAFAVEKAEDGALSIVMSSATEDRMGDSIKQDGWKLDAYKANPVLLWGHDSFAPPVGRVTSMALEAGALKAKGVEFVPKDVSPFAWSVGEMVRLGFVKAVSVGFRPLKWSFNDAGGVNFEEQELLELSFVSIPANPQALVEAKGLDVRPVDEWAAALVTSGESGMRVDQAKAWLGARRAALEAEASKLTTASEGVDDAPLPEFVSLAEAVRGLTDAVAENTRVQRAYLEAIQKTVGTRRLPLADDLASAVRAKLNEG